MGPPSPPPPKAAPPLPRASACGQVRSGGVSRLGGGLLLSLLQLLCPDAVELVHRRSQHPGLRLPTKHNKTTATYSQGSSRVGLLIV
jgi:hypothetical protein